MDFRDSKFRLILIVVALGIALVVVVASCGGDDDGGGTTGDASSSEGGDKGGEGGDPEGQAGSEDDGEGDGDPAPDSGEEQQMLAQVAGEDLTLTITRADREEGGFLTVEGTLHNGGGSGWRSSKWAGSESELAVNGFSMAGATLTAKAEGKKYLILRDTSGRCLCTRFDLQIEPDDTVNWFAQFPAPDPSTTQLDFQIGQLPPATFEIR